MSGSPRLRISHINLPARDPVALARWYESNLGFSRRGSFVYAAGTLIVFELGQPLGAESDAHFGFEVDTQQEVRDWAKRFGSALDVESRFASTKVRDPESNCFEIYWEPDGPDPDGPRGAR
jgi:catechol 2,3-dioxygenase-like lactoylglutathione lyase family enzyme